ncbi:MAG: DUF1269 domain-containing protein [Chloroflexota bacterium]|jgi:uncharacterized membrane protein
MATPYAGIEYAEGGSVTAIVFADEEQATSLLNDVMELEKQGVIELDDAVVAVKDQKGKVKIAETADTSTKGGTRAGGALGLFIGLMAGGPIGGLAVGLLGGRLVGKMIDIGIDQDFIKEVTDALEPGSSAALFQVKASHNPRAVRAMLAKYHGKIYSTSIDESVAEDLQRLLDE